MVMTSLEMVGQHSPNLSPTAALHAPSAAAKTSVCWAYLANAAERPGRSINAATCWSIGCSGAITSFHYLRPHGDIRRDGALDERADEHHGSSRHFDTAGRHVVASSCPGPTGVETFTD